VRFLGFPFEWEMAYNNLPCTTIRVVNDLNDRVEVTSSSENLKRGKGYLSAAKLSFPQQV
jgi:hypothetical protein